MFWGFLVSLLYICTLEISGIISMSSMVPCRKADAVASGSFCVLCLRPLLISEIPRNKHSWIYCPTDVRDLDKAKLFVSSKFLNGRRLRVVTIERKPFVKISGEKYSGVCFELLCALQRKYNFSREIFLPYDGNWGSELPNKSWTGMVGLVQSKKADIGVAGFSVTLERYSAVDFTESFHQEPTAILIPPPTEGEKLSVLIRPLSAQVWMGVGITVLVVAPSLYAMHVISLHIRGHAKASKNSNHLETILQLIHFMIGSLVQESVVSPVKTGRFLIILWWFVTIVLSNIYVAYLVSYLSAPRLFNVVNSLDDLVSQSHLKWTFRKSSALESLFKSNLSTGVYKSVGDGVAGNELVQTDYEGAQKALTGQYAFIKEESFLAVALGDDFIQTQKCRVTLAKQRFFKVETALITQKRSKLLPAFNNGIGWSVSTGVMEKWKDMHWPRHLWCEDAAMFISNTQPKTRKLKYEDVQGTIFLFLGGMLLSFTSFFGELIFRSFSKVLNTDS